jgi:hypothetical protein
MQEPYFVPWLGTNYSKHRTVILSESTYDWKEGRKWCTPQPDHPGWSVERIIHEWDHARYFLRLTEALCEARKPTQEQREARWNDFAYSIYVQKSVGNGVKSRPKKAHWDAARVLFPGQIGEIHPKPRKLIITGLQAWRNMQEAQIQLTPEIQAYDFGDELLWCLAVPHPANHAKGGGFRFKEVGMSIRVFMETSFPLKMD